MSSLKQIEANRRNALKSTGPTTPEGKRHSRCAAEGNELSSEAKRDIADCFLRLAALPTFALDRLSRYEHLLWRQGHQIVFTLESLRRRKRQPRRSTFP